MDDRTEGDGGQPLPEEIIPPGTPARLVASEDWRNYIRKAAGVLRTAQSHGQRFTVTGKLALLLAQQRTPTSPRGRGWETRALRDNVAKALAEIDALVWRAEAGDETAKQSMRQLRVEAGYMRQVSRE